MAEIDRERKEFPQADSTLNVAGKELAQKAIAACNYEQLGTKSDCQASFKLYDEALKILNSDAGIAPTHGRELGTSQDHGNSAIIMSVQNKPGATADEQKMQNLLDRNFNTTGIRYVYALTLAEYSREYEDKDALTTANKEIDQAAAADPTGRLRFEVMGAKERLNRGTWVDPQASKAEGMVDAALDTLNFPRLLFSVPESSRQQARELLADAMISNYEATREQLKFREPMLAWDESLLRDLTREAQDLVKYKLSNKH